MLDVMRFWLDRGVDGFRVDVMHHLVKDTQFATIRPTTSFAGHVPSRELLATYTADLPKCKTSSR
jgi:alpha-glucosidase